MHHYDSLRKFGPLTHSLHSSCAGAIRFPAMLLPQFDIGCVLPVTMARIYRALVRLSTELFVSDRLSLSRFTFCGTNHASHQ